MERKRGNPVPAVAAVARFLVRRRTRSVLAWVGVLIAAAAWSHFAWTCYDEKDRPERTAGHVYIDFGGQWLLGRMLVRGEGADLYHLDRLERVLQDAYPPADARELFRWLPRSPDDPNLGGALYPPIAALYFYPLGLAPPLVAYRIAQGLNLLLTFAIGFLVWSFTRGRVWAAVGAAAVMAMPGYNGALALAQNPPLTLALLMLGWLLVSRGRPWLGGAVWGLLAFKPVWAAAFFLAPFLGGRWRVCAAMLLTGAALALLTLPLVGWQAWLDWLRLGRVASAQYQTFENWIFLSRDLQNLPLRWLSFRDAVAVREEPILNQIGRALWLLVIAGTAAVALWRRLAPAGTACPAGALLLPGGEVFTGGCGPAGTDGPAVAFLLLGAYLSCFHFMYYDVLAAGLPLCVLFTEPAQYLRPQYLRPPGQNGGWLWNPAPATWTGLFFLLPHLNEGLDVLTGHKPTLYFPPWDTFCLVGLWAWCGWRWITRGNGKEDSVRFL